MDDQDISNTKYLFNFRKSFILQSWYVFLFSFILVILAIEICLSGAISNLQDTTLIQSNFIKAKNFSANQAGKEVEIRSLREWYRLTLSISLYRLSSSLALKMGWRWLATARLVGVQIFLFFLSFFFFFLYTFSEMISLGKWNPPFNKKYN